MRSLCRGIDEQIEITQGRGIEIRRIKLEQLYAMCKILLTQTRLQIIELRPASAGKDYFASVSFSR